MPAVLVGSSRLNQGLEWGRVLVDCEYLPGMGIPVGCSSDRDLDLLSREPRVRSRTRKGVSFHFAARLGKDRGARALRLSGSMDATAESPHPFKAGFLLLRHPLVNLRAIMDQGAYFRLAPERKPTRAPEGRTRFYPLYRLPVASEGSCEQ